MTKDEKIEVALFRYSIISDLVNAKYLERGEQERLIREKCSRKWSIPFSEKNQYRTGMYYQLGQCLQTKQWRYLISISQRQKR